LNEAKMKNFTPGEERVEIERLARLICRAVDATDPDALVARGSPQFTIGGYVVPSWTVPAWSMYTGAAKAVFDDARRQEELAEGVTNDV
jgi:hypothetical protein